MQPTSCRAYCDDGQASIVMVAIACASAGLVAILLAVAQVYIAQARLQTAADVAAAQLSAFRGDDPQAHARDLAQANGARTTRFQEQDDGRLKVVVTASAPPISSISGSRELTAYAFASLPVQSGGVVGHAPAGTGAYAGPLQRIDAATACPRVAAAYRRMQIAAAASGIRLWAVSGFRTHAEQAQLYASLGSALAARPGSSLHHQATELDITVGPAGSPTHRWLTANGPGFGFIQRYSWEPWHWGNVRGCGAR